MIFTLSSAIALKLLLHKDNKRKEERKGRREKERGEDTSYQIFVVAPVTPPIELTLTSES